MRTATAALAGDAVAVADVYARLQRIAPFATRGLVPEAELDELIQQVSIKLLLPDALPGRLASYLGRGALDGWLRVVITRAALSQRRAQRTAAYQEIDEERWLALPLLAADPGVDTWRRHGEHVSAAFERAVAALSRRARVLLRQHFVDGLSADDLARIHRVHRITAYRWIAQAKRDVVERLRGELAERMAASPSEIDALLRELRSSFSITIERLFRPRGGCPG